MDRIAVIVSPIRTPTSSSPAHHISVLAEALLQKNIDVVKIVGGNASKNFKHIACWGWKRGSIARENGHEVLVMERGYIGDRFKYSSLGWNGLNNHATFPAYPDDGGARFREHGGVIKPWKKCGDYILILGQVKGDASLKGQDITGWYCDVAERAKNIYGLPVYFRPHPESRRRGGYCSIDGIENMKGSLQEAMDGALFTIAYNSNSCIDSVLAGVPCYAGDKGTMAWDLCMKDLSEIVTPDREKTVHQIAWTQWTLEEIQSGYPLGALCALQS